MADGPGKQIDIESHPNRVRVTFAGAVVADTTRALVLRETPYRPVFYIPRADADMAKFQPTAHHTTCPWKGEASYFSLAAGGRTAENAVWTYNSPIPAVAAIAGMLAFYPDRVDAIEDLPA
jgi:uncharacterized protein (DUF427 family)